MVIFAFSYSEKKLKNEYRALLPQSCLEMALLCRNIGDTDQAQEWVKKCADYAGYLTEMLVAYRTEAILLEIRENKMKELGLMGHVAVPLSK